MTQRVPDGSALAMGRLRAGVRTWRHALNALVVKGMVLMLCVLVHHSHKALAETISNDECLACHGDKECVKKDARGKKISLFVDEKALAASAHRKGLCVGCHSDMKEVPHPDKFVAKPPVCTPCHKPQLETYGASVHGQARAAGETAAARCMDCHGGHEIQSPRLMKSTLYYTSQASICGKCHASQSRDFQRSVHGKALAAGVRDAPTCTDCHNEHKIQRLTDVASMKISGQVCGGCHSSVRLSSKYNMPAERVSTFFESYHGLAARLGSASAANCASCHGWHDVLPSSDPASRINRANLPKTCGTCHPGIGTRLAREDIRIHVAMGAAEGKPWIVNFISRAYILLIVFTIGGMIFHNTLDYVVKVRAHIKQANAAGEERFSRPTQLQHLALMILFALLAYTGFVHRYPDGFWAWPFRVLPNGSFLRGQIHRVCGWMFVGLLFVHLVGLLGIRAGRAELKELMPRLRDLKDLWATFAYNMGWRHAPPEHARFNYVEKSEYWALMWGSVIMIVTGVMLIFSEVVLRFLPKVWLDVAQIAHFYEAVLATLAILVWHFYAVVYDPQLYPMNPAWLTTKRLPPRPIVVEAAPEPSSDSKPESPQPPHVVPQESSISHARPEAL